MIPLPEIIPGPTVTTLPPPEESLSKLHMEDDQRSIVMMDEDTSILEDPNVSAMTEKLLIENTEDSSIKSPETEAELLS